MRALIYLLSVASIFLLIHCADLEEDITAPYMVNGAHDENVLNTESPDFHGSQLRNQQFNKNDCAACHYNNEAVVSTNTECTVCHHQEGVKSPSSTNYHGSMLRTNKWRKNDCSICHDDGVTTTSDNCTVCHHQDGVNNPSSDNYHADKILSSSWDKSDCQLCHFDGDTPVGDNSCLLCHHNDSYVSDHGDFIRTDNERKDKCSVCHTDAQVTTTSTSCSVCHHQTGVADPTSGNYHGGLILDQSWSTTDCSICHSDVSVTTSEVSCMTCHHQSNINTPGNDEFHGNLVRGNQWDMTTCNFCHGTDYAGGNVGKTCLTCHSDTPESCNTCHGSFSNDAIIYPPQDLDNNTDYTSRGVGAHVAHLNSSTPFGKNLVCTECHIVPDTYDAASHIDADGVAELVFGELAKLSTNVEGNFEYDSDVATVVPEPQYDFGTGSCSSVYCHGAFKNGNTDNVVSWTSGSDGIACGSCHGDPTTGSPLPGGTHFQLTNCDACHADVVEADGDNWKIKNESLHINGKLNVYGGEQDY